MPALDDAKDVLSALRLGWCIAEMRGRNRPGGPSGDAAPMPDHNDHALPLRIERSRTELRIEVRAVVAALAKNLHVDDSSDGNGFGAALDDKARALEHARAPRAADALQDALDRLERTEAGEAAAGTDAAALWLARNELRAGLARQSAVVERRRQALAAAQQVRDQQLAAAGGLPEADPPTELVRAQAAVESEQAAVTGEANGLAVLEQVIGALEAATGAGPETVATIAECIRQGQLKLSNAADAAWEDLAEEIWLFDARAQDTLNASSEIQSIGYQLGRGLAETYWALDPGQASGSTSWSFLLGHRRCSELSRLVGRLSGYMGEYTGPAIASSVEIWKDVAKTPDWLGDPHKTARALYKQTRRWYELIILGQDPTTLIGPTTFMTSYRTVRRAVRLFLPQLAATTFGIVSLVALVVLLSVGGAAWQKAVYGILAAFGLSLAGVTGSLKNSAQAMLTRLRQDAYTDLIVNAVQTAPPPPKKSYIQNAISRRKLTPATPN